MNIVDTPDEGWVPLGPAEKRRLTPIVHEFWGLTRIVHLRDRLRCPGCKAVGTFKPHGGTVDAVVDWWAHRRGEMPTEQYRNLRTVRRWLCKYCGRYEGPRSPLDGQEPQSGVSRAWPAETAWAIEGPEHDPDLWHLPTPFEQVHPRWPWRG